MGLKQRVQILPTARPSLMSMGAGHVSEIVTLICMMFILGSLIVVLSHKIFGLITHLPENVTKWIGQQVQNLGEHQDEQRTRTIFAGAASRGEGAALNTMRMGGRGGGKGNKAFPLAGAEGGGGGAGEEDY